MQTTFFTRLTPFFLVLLTLAFIDVGLAVSEADARSRGGGRSFKRAPIQRKAAPQKPAQTNNAKKKSGGFGRGLAGGLLGGAMGALLFGGLFGATGNGFGILPLLIFGGIGFFLYKRYMKRAALNAHQGHQYNSTAASPFPSSPTGGMSTDAPPPPPVGDSLEEGLEMIQATDSSFDPKYFIEVASDVFFQVQAGWMRRDLDSYGHLLGDQLADEYKEHFAQMRQQGHINKLESIAVRKVEIVDAGNDGTDDFVTVLFTASLLDYTVEEEGGALVKGSMTDPVKFAEKWTWSRPVRTQSWKLEAIEVLED